MLRELFLFLLFIGFIASVCYMIWRAVRARSDKAFVSRLQAEIPRWIAGGFLREEHKEPLLALYQQNKVDMKSRAPMILVSLASVLLMLGVILFYAANWKFMPPALKLMQVFGLIILNYSLAYYLICVKDVPRIGRAFLVMGMVSFGVGIVLVAQIFHITAHGGTGLMIWTLGTMLMSWITRERWGYYLAAALALIWTSEVWLAYEQPNSLFPLFALALLYMFYTAQARVGMVLIVCALVYWLYQWNGCWIIDWDYLALDHSDEQPLVYACLLLHLPVGIILVAIARLCEKNHAIDWAAQAVTGIGWTLALVPWIALSWPLGNWKIGHQFLWEVSSLNFFHTQYAALWLCALVLTVVLYVRRLDYRLAALSLALGLVYVLPIGIGSWLVVVTHLALLAYLGTMLATAHVTDTPRRVEKWLALSFMFLVVVGKGLVFFGYGVDSRKFYLAYCLGFVVFGTVCFLINQLVALICARAGKDYPSSPINTASAIMGFIIVYLVSFKIKEQASIFSAQPIVLVMLWLFLALALCLYAIVYLRSRDKMLVTLSAVTFFIAVGTLFISGPDVTWIAYSLIFNILLFVLEGSAIYYGIKTNAVRVVNVAIVVFVVHVLTRYFDLFFDMLSGSALFIVTGLVLLGGGYILEKNRRLLLKKMEQGSKQ